MYVLKSTKNPFVPLFFLMWIAYLIFTSDFVDPRPAVRYQLVKTVGGTRNRTRDPSHERWRRRPLSHGDYRIVTFLSWYVGRFSIHYI